MKVSMRLLSCLLCLSALLLTLASCTTGDENEPVPEGMLQATCSGADYRLYVPTHWTVNTAYGVSAAYRTYNSQSTVSVNSYPITEALNAEMTAALEAQGVNPLSPTERSKWFGENRCQATVRERALSKEIKPVAEECTASVLGGLTAYQLRYSAIINGVELQFLQRIAEKGGRFYVFTFSATNEMYQMCKSNTQSADDPQNEDDIQNKDDIQKILYYFEFKDTAYVPRHDAKKLSEDAVAPAGMKIASGDDVAYRFFVPESWEIDMEAPLYAAYVKEDRTSVSVMPYSPPMDSISVKDYFTMTKDQLSNLSGEGGFEMISDENNPVKVDLAGSKNQAWVFEYRLRVGGETYRYRQYIVAHRSMIYNITYTATEAAYEAHLGELDAIIAAFAFR